VNPPTQEDVASSVELKKSLIAFRLYESPEEAQTREAALGKLNLIVREWSRSISIKKVLKNPVLLFFPLFPSLGLHPFSRGSQRQNHKRRLQRSSLLGPTVWECMVQARTLIPSVLHQDTSIENRISSKVS
jgi:hypothetical protein